MIALRRGLAPLVNGTTQTRSPALAALDEGNGRQLFDDECDKYRREA